VLCCVVVVELWQAKQIPRGQTTFAETVIRNGQTEWNVYDERKKVVDAVGAVTNIG